jgi:putative flavoprotein involved in K+ transport
MVDGPRADHFDVVVVGGGQAGLAMGYFLARQGRRFVILERDGLVASAWRQRWESLTLFTPRRYDGLPGLLFPGDPDGYPTRDEVIAYLEEYARKFERPVEATNVRRLAAGDGRYFLEADGREITADSVVAATGPFQTPYVPDLATKLEPSVVQMASAGYRRPDDLPEGTILVVGGGNTGFQIAVELSATRRVVLAVGSGQTPLPQRLLGRDLFWWLTKSRLLATTVDSRLGRKLRHRDTLIGSSPRRLRRSGVELKPRTVSASGPHPRLRRRKRSRGGRRDLGDRVPARLFVDRTSCLRRRRARSPQAGGYGPSGPLLSRPHMAAHARLGATRLGEGGR